MKLPLSILLLGIVLLGSSLAARDINSPYANAERTEQELYNMVLKYNGEVSTIGRTVEQQPIYLYRFGNGPGFMFDGRVHGPEDCGTEAGKDFIRWVYEDESPEARRIRGNVTLLFIPEINKDRPTSRLNARGVNLNRNFPNGWGTSGTSYAGEDYRGPRAASEPETRAIMNALNLYDPRIYFNVHCGMQIITGGGNTTISRQIIKNLKELDSKETYRYYSPHYSQSCGTGGYVKAGACDDNTSSWLFELSTWGGLPDNQEAFLDKWRPAYLPFYEAAALTAADFAPIGGFVSGDGSAVSTLNTSAEPKPEPLKNDSGKEEESKRGDLPPPPVNVSQEKKEENIIDKLKEAVSKFFKRWPVTHEEVTIEPVSRAEVSRVSL